MAPIYPHQCFDEAPQNYSSTVTDEQTASATSILLTATLESVVIT